MKVYPTKNIYWRDVIAEKLPVRLDGSVYVVDTGEDASLIGSIGTDHRGRVHAVAFWHGQESAQAQRALDALISWQEKTRQDSIERIVKKVVCK